jgi:hypothetical protein
MRRKALVAIGVSVALVVIGAGFVHVVHGGNAGLTLCAKDGWGLSRTFVDVRDYVDQPMFMADAAVTRALLRCKVIRNPGLERQRYRQIIEAALASIDAPARIEQKNDVWKIDASSATCKSLEPLIRSRASDAPPEITVVCDSIIGEVFRLRRNPDTDEMR